ncbi:hypothetical protein ARMSODRAFT_976190 [Armillaria solidipes]|uniref:Uncharacterized protein n=1 Tax=Armillaria solidipes TaxID=1076256 RepID=A0A2H3BWV4_9AGAR|nr:hypothetical protein ARMSODRAFT_976190 [Armillaria solidipes]
MIHAVHKSEFPSSKTSLRNSDLSPGGHGDVSSTPDWSSPEPSISLAQRCRSGSLTPPSHLHCRIPNDDLFPGGNGDGSSTPYWSSPEPSISLAQRCRSESLTPLRLPKLLRLYLDAYEYSERFVSQQLEKAERRGDFITALLARGIPEQAGSYIWDLYFGLIEICF